MRAKRRLKEGEGDESMVVLGLDTSDVLELALVETAERDQKDEKNVDEGVDEFADDKVGESMVEGIFGAGTLLDALLCWLAEAFGRPPIEESIDRSDRREAFLDTALETCAGVEVSWESLTPSIRPSASSLTLTRLLPPVA